jgi:hypothetical protein
MDCRLFLSYHGDDKNAALAAKEQLVAAGVDVVMYDPGLKWDDALSTVVPAIENADCVVYLMARKNPSNWVRAELEWAGINHVPIFKVEQPALLPQMIPHITQTAERERMALSEEARLREIERIFSARVDKTEIYNSEEISRGVRRHRTMQDSKGSLLVGGLLYLILGVLVVFGGLASGVVFLLLNLFSLISIWWAVGAAAVAAVGAAMWIVGNHLLKASDKLDVDVEADIDF